MASEKAPKKKRSLPRRILRWTGFTLLALIILAFILPFLFKDKLIAKAKEEINKQLDATVTFGDFDLGLLASFPDFRLTMKDLKVVGKNEFAKDTLASIPELKVDINLMSVIRGDEYKINSISLDKPRILARVLKDGKANWDIVKSAPDTAKTAAASEPTKFKLSLKNFSISEGYIVYDDASLGVKTVLDNMDYKLSGDFTQDNFLMKNKLDVERFTMEYGGMSYLNKVKTAIKADVDMDMVNWKFTLKDNEFNLNDLAFGLDGFFAMPGEDYNMDLKFSAKQSEFKSFLSLIPGAYTKDFADVKASGKLSFDGFLKGLYSEKQNKMPGFGLNFQVVDGSFKYPSVPKSVNAINIDCKIDDASGVTDQTKIDVNKFHIDFGGNPIDAALHVSTPVSDANINGWLKCALDLGNLRDLMPLEKDDQLTGKVNADVKMNGRMSQIEKSQYDQFQCSGTIAVMNLLYKTKDVPYGVTISGMNMNFTPQYVALTNFDGKLGRNDIHADGRIDNLMIYLFKDSLLRGNFNMHSSLMDLNQFTSDASTSAQPTPADTAAMSVIDVPGNIDFTLNSTINKLIYDNINMDNVTGTIIVRNKAVRLDQLKMNLMGGSMLVNGSYSTAAVVPKVNFDMSITDFDIQQTVKTFATVQKMVPVAQFSKGKYSTSLNYTSDLDNKMMPVVTTINGKGTLSTKQVEVDGFGPLKKLDDALKINKFKKITLNDLKQVSFTIENGRVTTDPFDFKIGNATGKVGGSTGVDQSINYTMDVAIPRTEFGPANTALNGLVSSATAKGVPVKLGDNVDVQALFGGTATNPTVKTNLKGAGDNLKDQVKDIVKDKVDSVKKDLTNKACVEAQKQLDAAKVSAANVKASAYKAADDAKASAYAQADKIEKSYKNPLEKAGKKVAADAARKTADEANKKAKASADKAEQDAISKAQADHDAKCK